MAGAEKKESFWKRHLVGSLGATTTVIVLIYLLATLVVTAPILNSSLHEELSRKEAR